MKWVNCGNDEQNHHCMCGELFVNLCVCGGKFLLRVEMGVTKMWVYLVQAENNGA